MIEQIIQHRMEFGANNGLTPHCLVFGDTATFKEFYTELVNQLPPTITPPSYNSFVRGETNFMGMKVLFGRIQVGGPFKWVLA